MSNQFIKNYNRFYRTKEYLKFKIATKSVVYEFLRAAIIRESFSVKLPVHGGNGGSRIYRDFFKNGKLVSSYSQKNIAECFGFSQQAISRHIKALVKDGFIKLHKRETDMGIAYDYEFGWYTGEFGKPDYKEYYYLDEYFDKVYTEERKARDEAKFGKYDYDGPLEEVEREELTPEEEYGHIIIKFKTPDGFVVYAMEQAGRVFSADEMRQHRALWERVHSAAGNH